MHILPQRSCEDAVGPRQVLDKSEPAGRFEQFMQILFQVPFYRQLGVPGPRKFCMFVNEEAANFFMHEGCCRMDATQRTKTSPHAQMQQQQL